MPGAFVRSLVRLRRFPPVMVAVIGAVTVLGAQNATIQLGKRQAGVQMLDRTGFLDHVKVLAGKGSNGLWVGESAAKPLGLRPGSTVTVSVEGISTPVRVAGIYRDMGI